MKMVKSLLLGSAAGLVAVAGAQAADLPVKAKPVQYVKICSLYGVGFYYIPGTDMCIKIGGYARAEYMYGGNNSTVVTNGGDINNRLTNNSVWRVRGYVTADARNQTEYGTVRGYLAVGINTTDTIGNGATAGFNANRAFIQFAGFTFGLAQSFFDFYSGAAVAYWGSFPQSDTGDGGWMVLGYTAQLGNGFSATLSAEMRRTTQVLNFVDGTGAALVGSAVLATATSSGANGSIQSANAGFTAGGYGGFQSPDIVGNLRVDQAWGSAQIMGALHQVNAAYFGAAAPGATTAALGAPEVNGHPDDKWGFAVGGGFKLNTPMIGQGDYFQTQVTYTQGALRYVHVNDNTNSYIQHGDSAAYGILSDAVFGGNLLAGNAASLQLTTGWGVNAAYEHFWNPRWRTSAYGGYAETKYNSTANANLCAAEGTTSGGVLTSTANGTGAGTAAVAVPGCNNDWNQWWIGSRTQWNVSKDFYMGVDVLYQRIQSANTANGLLPTGVIPVGTSTSSKFASDQDNWAFRFRVHRDFYP
jgi:hypothetical protein